MTSGSPLHQSGATVPVVYRLGPTSDRRGISSTNWSTARKGPTRDETLSTRLEGGKVGMPVEGRDRSRVPRATLTFVDVRLGPASGHPLSRRRAPPPRRLVPRPGRPSVPTLPVSILGGREPRGLVLGTPVDGARGVATPRPHADGSLRSGHSRPSRPTSPTERYPDRDWEPTETSHQKPGLDHSDPGLLVKCHNRESRPAGFAGVRAARETDDDPGLKKCLQ